VLVDSTIWSLAIRRPSAKLNPREQPLLDELTELIHEGRAALIGVIRQELLSGLEEPKFERLRGHLQHFPDEPATTEDHEEAARLYNACRRAGIVGSIVDMLICAIAVRRDLAIFTADRDFDGYARHLPVRLHQARERA
jgi:predicted nucleic acid-binding protein